MAVFTKNLRKHIFVHPGDSNKLHTAIKIALMNDKKKYSDSLEGALLDVSGIKVVGDRYRIVNGYLSMEVVADFQVFSPSIGMTVDGVINKVHRNHYGCLVLNLFNASLSVPEGSDLAPSEGDACTFVVTRRVVDGDLLFIKGELQSVTPSEPTDTPALTGGQDIYPPVTSTLNGAALADVKAEGDDRGGLDTEISAAKTPKKRKRERLSGEQAESKEDSSVSASGDGDNKTDEGGVELDVSNSTATSCQDGSAKSSKKHKKKHKTDRNSTDPSDSPLNHKSPSVDWQNATIKKEKDLDVTHGNSEIETSPKSKKKLKKEKHRKKDKSDTSFTDLSLSSSTSSPTKHSSPPVGWENVIIKTEKGLDESYGNAEVKDSPKSRKKAKKEKHKKKNKSDMNSSNPVPGSPVKNASPQVDGWENIKIKKEKGLNNLFGDFEEVVSPTKVKKEKGQSEASTNVQDVPSPASGDCNHHSLVTVKQEPSDEERSAKKHKRKRKSRHEEEGSASMNGESSVVGRDSDSSFSNVTVKAEPTSTTKKAKTRSLKDS